MTNSTKDTDYVSTKVKQYIDRVYPKNVIHMYFDNAAAMQNAAYKMSKKRLHIYWQRCTTHCLIQFFIDWGK